MNSPGVVGALVAFLVVLLGDRAEAAGPKAVSVERRALRPDPAVRRGVLPNGLRYLVMRNASPRDAVSLRFAVDVGSYEETEAERGYAHFIEHMAFRSTRDFPDGKLDQVFAPWGVQIGRDQNAATTIFATTYQLDLPKPDAAQLKRAMGWLRDVADGILFTPEAVDRERGVVLAEKEARGNSIQSAQEAIAQFQAAGLRSLNRNPIGLKSTLNAATAADLKRFHDAWYRPQTAIVTVVGDRPVDDLEALVTSTFSDWRAAGPPPTRAALAPPNLSRPQAAFVVSGATLPTAMSACRLKSGQGVPPQTLSRLREQAETEIWQTILNKRLGLRIADDTAHLLGATMVTSDMRDVVSTCLGVIPTIGSWETGLAAAQAELNRFAKDGPTDIETETAIELVRAKLRGAVLSQGSRVSRNLANDLQAKALNRMEVTAPADGLYDYDLAVEDLTPDMVKARFLADWSGSEPLVAMMAPSPPQPAALLAAWSRPRDATGMARYADQTLKAWSYDDFGKPGKVVARAVIADPGFSRLTFANGVVLNFRQSQLEPNRALINLNFGGGRRDVSDRDAITAQMATIFLTSGGLGRHSNQDLQTLFASRMTLDFQTVFGPRMFGLRSAAFAGDVTTQLQILAAYFTDPGFRPDLDARLPSAFEYMYRTFLTGPQVALTNAVTQRVDPDWPGNIPPLAELQALKAADFARVLKPILTTATVEVTIIGDLDEASAIQAVAQTFAALPARVAPPSRADEPRFLRYPDAAPPLIRITHQGPPDKAAALLVWPLYVATPERRREEYSLRLLAAVFDTALRRRVREELGKTYAPSVVTSTPDFADQGALQVSIDAEPQDIVQLIAETRSVASKLQNGEITPQMLEDARQPLLAAHRAQRGTNAWWGAAMSGSAREPAFLAEALQYEPLLSAVTLEDLRAAAATWLAREPIVGAAYPQAPGLGAKP